MSTSARELTDPVPAGTARLAQPEDPPLEKAAGEIHQAVAHTREQLAGTVEELVDEIDLPARVMDKAHQSKDTVHAKIDEVEQRLHKGTETVQDKAEKAAVRAKNLTDRTLTKLPPFAAKRIEGLMRQAARQRPVPAAAAVLGMLVLLRRLRRGNRR